MKAILLLPTLVLGASVATADNSTLDAAIGGGLGGAAGAAIGNELGGRDGAIIGGAVGGGVGAADATDDDGRKGDVRYREGGDRHRSSPSQFDDHFCPPGQAKKGRC